MAHHSSPPCFDWSAVDRITGLTHTETAISMECGRSGGDGGPMFRLQVQLQPRSERVTCCVCYYLSSHPDDRLTVVLRPRVKDMRTDGWSLEKFCGDLLRAKRYPFGTWRNTLIQKGRDAL